MPCENCNVQFTVFKRKRLCSECRRFYCNHCLVKRSEKVLCEKCVVLTARPLSKIDLLKLKPKDLIVYLQSKHISTAGCVEKEELVNLIINTAAETTSPSRNASSPGNVRPEETTTGDSENCSNPFDHIKQTCQSLFSSFAEKIVDLNFENKPQNNDSNTQSGNILNQPRFQTREMPTYASGAHIPNMQPQNLNFPMSLPRSRSSTSNLSNENKATAQSHTPSSSSPSSPIVSIGSISSNNSQSQPAAPPQQLESDVRQRISGNTPIVHKTNIRTLIDNFQDVNTSGCECSDDEVLAEFSQCQKSRPDIRQSFNTYTDKLSSPSQTDSAFEDQIPGPSGSGAHSASSSKISGGDNQRNTEESSGSSFEELGAVGGSNDWQIVETSDVPQSSLNTSSSHSAQPSTSSGAATFQTHSSDSSSNLETRTQKPRRLNRRRSDGCVVHSSSNRHQQEASLSIQLDNDESDENPNRDNPSCKRVRKCCHKCGKTKNSLKSKLLKFRRQLELKQLSEAEMKNEIEEFLNYLENKSRDSFDRSDSETNLINSLEPSRTTAANIHSITIEDVSVHHMGDDDGIHVYGSKVEDSYGGSWRHDGRFLNLADFKSRSELEELSVKQLKEILMLNRVDFKGCCEKQELFERVLRLWIDLQTSPAVDKLPTDDLCKICMDAPIECVILECGHMATCTNCGKVLSECPICRQYIVRVVRFFRA